MIPNLPAVVSEALSLMFNAATIQQVDFYASKPSAWWGVSVKIGATGGVGALLGAFSFIMQELGFPSLSSFTPRFSIAGKLSGNGLPIAVGLDYKSGSGSSTKVGGGSCFCCRLWLYWIPACYLHDPANLTSIFAVAVLLRKGQRLPERHMHGRQGHEKLGWHLCLHRMVRAQSEPCLHV